MVATGTFECSTGFNPNTYLEIAPELLGKGPLNLSTHSDCWRGVAFLRVVPLLKQADGQGSRNGGTETQV